jgi:hypothetical protein
VAYSPVKFNVEYPRKLSRGKLILKTLFGAIYVGIPHGVVLMLYAVAASIVMFVAWWAILFTGEFPKGMFDFVVKYMRWGLRVSAYMGLMTDVYPPFNGEEDIAAVPPAPLPPKV